MSDFSRAVSPRIRLGETNGQCAYRRVISLLITTPTKWPKAWPLYHCRTRRQAISFENAPNCALDCPASVALDVIERLCDEYRISLAIRNHPRSPQSMYWRPEKVLAVCNGRGLRIGACCDTGHRVRSGLDAVACLKQLEGRVLELHLKEVAEKGKPESRDVPWGKGVANCAAILRELKRQGFHGVAVIEYEHDSDALMADVAQCVALVERTAQE